MPDWAGVFAPDLSLAESFLRGSVVYLSLLVLFRVVLKRQAGSLGLPDIMLAVLVSECVSNALSAEAKSVPNGLAAAAALLFWNYALDRLSNRWPWLERLLEPAPVPLVRDGEPIRENMDREGVSQEELQGQLRESGVDDVSRVRSAILESNGSVSVIPKEAEPEEPGPAESNGEGRPNFDYTVERFLAAAEEVRAAVAWHEEQAVEHKAAAKAAREALARHGLRAVLKAAKEEESPGG